MFTGQDLWRWAVTVLGPVPSIDTWHPINTWLNWDLGSLDALCCVSQQYRGSSCCDWRGEFPLSHLILIISQFQITPWLAILYEWVILNGISFEFSGKNKVKTSVLLSLTEVCAGASITHSLVNNRWQQHGPLMVSTLIRGCMSASADTPFTNDKANELERSAGHWSQKGASSNQYWNQRRSPFTLPYSPFPFPFLISRSRSPPSLSFWALRSNTLPFLLWLGALLLSILFITYPPPVFPSNADKLDHLWWVLIVYQAWWEVSEAEQLWYLLT